MSESTFSCIHCSAVEMASMVADPSAKLCSECSTGEWHGFFEKSSYDRDVNDPVSNVSSSDDPFSDDVLSYS